MESVVHTPCTFVHAGVWLLCTLAKARKTHRATAFPLEKCFLIVLSFAAKVAHFSEKAADFCPKRPMPPLVQVRKGEPLSQVVRRLPQRHKRHSSVSLFPNTPTSMILQIGRWRAYRRKSTVVSNFN